SHRRRALAPGDQPGLGALPAPRWSPWLRRTATSPGLGERRGRDLARATRPVRPLPAPGAAPRRCPRVPDSTRRPDARRESMVAGGGLGARACPAPRAPGAPARGEGRRALPALARGQAVSGESTPRATVAAAALERVFGPRAACNACAESVADYRVVALFLHDT